MIEFVWMTSSSLLAGAYVAWKGYSWFRHKPKQVVRWEVIPCVRLSPTIWGISTLDEDFHDSKELKRWFSKNISREEIDLVQASVLRTVSENTDLLSSVGLSASVKNSIFTKSKLSTKLCSTREGSFELAKTSSFGQSREVNPASEDDFTDMYEILTEVGRGGFGIVYKAMQLSSQELVAVKYVSLGEYKKADLRELDILKSVQGCSSIIRLIDNFQLESDLVIVMELASGCLADIQLRNEDAVFLMSLFLDIQNAVAYLHDRMIAHRDLKPENILIVKGKATVADFGCAETVQGFYGKETFLRGRVGTYAYMAPEVVCNTGRYSALKADIWSVGCIIYFLLTGTDLYVGECPQYTVIEHDETRVNLPSWVDVNAVVSSMVASLKCALVYDPGLRPPINIL